jgi:hypothetical protein
MAVYYLPGKAYTVSISRGGKMASSKSEVLVKLDSASIAVLKAILHQVEQVKVKREQQRQAKDNTVESTGQLPLPTSTADTKGADA